MNLPLFSLIGKDLRLFFRSRVSAIVVLLIPFFIVLLAGYAFDSSELSNVDVGIYSEGYTDFTDGLVVDFEADGFSCNKYDSSEACIESVRYSESQICVVFPANLSGEVSNEEIVFYADYSRINLVDNLVGRVEESVFVKTSGVGEDLAQDLIDSLNNVRDSLPGVGSEVSKALSAAKSGKSKSSDLSFPVEDIENVISDLEDIEDDINDSGVRGDVEDIIVALEEVRDEGESLDDSFDSISEGQVEVVSRLDGILSSLNALILALNSDGEVSAVGVVSPIKTRIESVSEGSKHRDYMIPIIFSLIALFGAILLSSTFVLKSKKTRAFFRNFMVPVSDVVFVLATYFVCLFILVLQFAFVFAGVKWILRMDIFSSFLPLLVVLIVSFSVFIFIGMFIGYLFRSDETVIFSSMIIAALFMFFSNVILPLENISGGMVEVLEFNPLVVSSLALNKVLLFGLGFDAIAEELTVLGGFFVVFFFASYLFRKMTKRNAQ